LVDWNSPSRFKNYPLKDIIFDNDYSGFTNGEATSRYKVTAKDGTKTYFASDGRLLAIVDRYGNQITFQHTTLNGHPVISKITDTIGREVTISYSSTQVTVTAPDGQVWRYNLTVTEGGKVLLDAVTDPLGRVTRYNYGLQTGAFSFTSRLAAILQI